MKEFLIDCYRGVSAGRHSELVVRAQLCAVKGDDRAPSTGHKGRWHNYKTQLCATEQLIVSKNQLNITQSVFRNFDILEIEQLIMKIISRFINN